MAKMMWMSLHVEIELKTAWITCIKMSSEVSDMIRLLVEDDVDVLHVEIKLEMTWIICIKRVEVSS
jgi:hypothetical protein